MLPPRIWLAVDLEPRFPNVLMSRCGHYKLIQPGTENLINASNRTKRAFDLVFGSLLFAISLVFLVLIGLLIAATSGFPIVYRQDRIGAHGQHFSILKFRTMTERQDAGFSQAVINDPRVTSFGRFLRRTSLDELLQLINVIKGDMSLVGPRPHAPETQVEGVNFENAVKFYRLRHRVKPGITGLAQIRGQRGETRALATLERRIASDLEYIENWSIWLDVAIIFKTIPIFFTQRNAY
jgi:exopolysaccharide biosynthesis polyprenyl glycosylphosphotransferase